MIDNILPPKGQKTIYSQESGFAEQDTVEASENTSPKDNFGQEEIDDSIVIDQDGKPLGTEMKSKAKMSWLKRKLPNWQAWSRKKKTIAITIIILIVAGIGADLYWVFFHSNIEPSIAISSNPKTTIASPLTGVQVKPELAKRPVTGIMIENSLDARPQSGLQDAGVVYEAVAEGGVSRFLALYQEGTPQYIGPVRSLRPYYIDFAAPFQASIVHVGGSPDALSEVENGSFRNLDQFFNGNYFTRINVRAAPHNVYTSFTLLDALNKSKGYKSSKFVSFPRKDDAKLAVPTAKSIDFAISGYYYNVHYAYSAKTNSYLRSEGGAPHMDLVSAKDTTGVQLHPKAVIALIMNQSSGALDASGAYYSEYADTGSGTMYVFQDGGVTKGTWSKSGTDSQFKFINAAGKPIRLNAGQTWFTVLGSSSMVSYKP